MKTALITGITGQDGSYLAELLLSKGYVVHGIVRRSSSLNTARIDHLYKDPHEPDARLFLHFGDLSDGIGLRRIIEKVQPDEVYNLAAQSHVRVSFDEPVYTFDTDAAGTLRLLEALRDVRLPVRVYQAGSSEMFGGGTALSESSPFRPRSPYAVAKVAAHWLAVNYREAYGMHISNGILFNHTSPRRGETFVERKITHAAARIAAGQQRTLFLGNVHAQRDWGYAPDYVQAMWLMLQQEQPDDYVIATGVMHSVTDVLDAAFGFFKLDWREYVRTDSRYARPNEVTELCGDATRARAMLGWAHTMPFNVIIDTMCEADRCVPYREAYGMHISNGILCEGDRCVP